MAVDRNLFLNNLAVVAIMKDEAPYAKEWLDYHILAGVDHFYIYDNDSPDNLKEVLQPYIDAGIVTYTFYPGKCRQMEAYNDAVNRYKFFCRYMAWIDADEFILPKSNRSIADVVDEILADKARVSGVAANIFQFGSNGQKEADYSKGVLERFTRHSSVDWLPVIDGVVGGTAEVRTIANPRKIKVIDNPHFAYYFENYNAINENGGIVPLYSNDPPTVEKIVVNHYRTKSFEEYEKKVRRGNADHFDNKYDLKNFEKDDRNEVFDDSILKYRDERRTNQSEPQNQNKIQTLLNALVENLSPTLEETTPNEFYKGKMETFLTCRKLAHRLYEKLPDKESAKTFEEASLNAIHKTFFKNADLADFRLLFGELPEILSLDYPAVKNICDSCIEILPELMEVFKMNNLWREFYELEYLLRMVKTVHRYKYAIS